MKSYLSLIPLSAKLCKRQNRMTILCIVISVLLVTAIFSIADMFIRTESSSLQQKHGSWHISIENISHETADKISSHSDVIATGWLESYNRDADKPYYIDDRKAALYGTDNVYMSQLTDAVEEGHFPENDNEIMLSSNAKLGSDIKTGSTVTLKTPAGNTDFKVSGFGSDDKDYYGGQTYLTAAYMTQSAFDSVMQENGMKIQPSCYILFDSSQYASDAVSTLSQQYDIPETDISENTAVMGISGQSSNESFKNIYGIAAVLFIMVLLAGALMISGSMNSTVARRTQFFGMMRCIGASRRQIIRYVRFEALNWCKTAVPTGLMAGTAVSWGICAILHYGIGGEFSTMPVFSLSPVGLICGAFVGVATVLLAAHSPAKRAAKVSPVAAVSGNAAIPACTKHKVKASYGNIETMLGVHQAVGSKKNIFLMTASFSLSIIMFLCFSVGLNFARELLPSMREWQPDITFNGYANELILSHSLSDDINLIPGVKQVFGCSYMENLPVASTCEKVDHVNLLSYSDSMLDSSADSVAQGEISGIYGNSSEVMTVTNKDNPLEVGDTVTINNTTLEITCTVSDSPYPDGYSIICSEETFEQLTGITNYSLIGVQLSDDATDETVQQLSSLADSDVIFTDLKENNQQDHATYMAFSLIVYSFLAIIAIITLFNIINSISMSVTSRIRQYGAMKAVGMDDRQLTKMIAAESFTYAVCGLVVGCTIGIILNRFLYTKLITNYFGIPWSLPIMLLIIIVVFDIVAAMAAVYAPAKRIHSMSVTEVINEL